jgi:uncharacterized protein
VNKLAEIVKDMRHVIVACSGGVDSLLLATVFHRAAPGAVIVAHALGPAVPAAATQRVKDCASSEGWQLELIHSGEFADPVYRANPIDRCYYCKSHLYTALTQLAQSKLIANKGYTMVSGANVDDLGEYRPGLKAAEEFKVRHPFVEAGMTKQHIRELSRSLGLAFAELPASPCLASRLYTGTPVTVTRLAVVEHGEEFLKEQTGIRIVRCRLKQDEIHIEVPREDQCKILPPLVARLHEELRLINPSIRAVHLDPLPYQPGRAFVLAQ